MRSGRPSTALWHTNIALSTDLDPEQSSIRTSFAPRRILSFKSSPIFQISRNRSSEIGTGEHRIPTFPNASINWMKLVVSVLGQEKGLKLDMKLAPDIPSILLGDP